LALAVIAQDVTKVTNAFLAACDLLRHPGSLCCALLWVHGGIPLQLQDRGSGVASVLGGKHFVVRDDAFVQLIFQRAQRAQITHKALAGQLPVDDAGHLVEHQPGVLRGLVHPLSGDGARQQSAGVALLLIQALKPARILCDGGWRDAGEQLRFDGATNDVWCCLS